MAGTPPGTGLLHCMAGCHALQGKGDGKVKHKALYNILGLNREGKKEVLGMYISESEGANYWLQVLTHLQNRGLRDILIACTDHLTGFSEAIRSVYPKTDIQLCIIHQTRNSLKYYIEQVKGKQLPIDGGQRSLCFGSLVPQ
ncbi:MAG: transposase [Anditalea sp.]